MKFRKTAAFCTALAAIGALASGCGRQDQGPNAAGGQDRCSPGVLEEVNARLGEYKAAPTFEAPGPAFDTSSAVGKTIFVVPLNSTDTHTKLTVAAEEEAAKAARVNLQVYSTQGSPSEWVSGMTAGINARADLILLHGSPDPLMLRPQLQAATAAGIPVISTHRFDVEDVDAQLQAIPDLAGIVPANHKMGAGTLPALYAIAHTKCSVNAVLLSANDVTPADQLITDAWNEELGKYCPDTCNVKVLGLPYSRWATEARGELQSALTTDPTVNVIAPNYDYGVTFAEAAIMATARSATSDILSYNGSAPIMQMIQDGRPLVMDVGEPLGWLGYANIDQALRVLTGNDPLKNHNTPLRVWDASNLADAGTPVSQTEGYGSASEYIDGYRSLWGLQN